MKNFILAALLILGLSSCEKSPFDYRNKYLGNYNFTNVYSKSDLNGTVSTTTKTYFGKASADGDKNVVVEFDNSKSQTLRIDNDGNLFNSCDNYVGHFESESKIQVALDKQKCTTVNVSDSSTVTIVGERKY